MIAVRRCAVYTRKSSEEGLEQTFNSLHAQREACEAYIKSQAHEGWKLVRTAYADGGLSGGPFGPSLIMRSSEARASAIARSSVTSRKLCRPGSMRAMRSRQAGVSSTGEICLAAIWRAASEIVRNGCIIVDRW